MSNLNNQTDFSSRSSLSPAEKNLELFLRQKQLLATLLSTKAISQAQHDKSLNCLIEKMGIKEDI